MIAINGLKFRKCPEAYSLCGFETCRNYHIQKQASCMHTVKPHRKTSDLTFKLCVFKEVESFIISTLWRFWGMGDFEGTWFQIFLQLNSICPHLHSEIKLFRGSGTWMYQSGITVVWIFTVFKWIAHFFFLHLLTHSPFISIFSSQQSWQAWL